MDAVNLADVTSELYGLDPASFTAARNSRAKEATAAGDRELAAAIRKLAKPTAAAWLANRLARSRTSAIDKLIGLGSELRRAQGSGERAEMRRLIGKRRTLISDLVRSASASAREGGHCFGSAVERQLEEILEAAVADEALGAALREGRLTEPFRFVGFGEVSDSVSGPAGKTEPKTKTAAAPTKAAAKAEARRRTEANRRTAREALDEIEASVEKARARLEAANERLERASKLMKEAEAEKAASTEDLRRAREGLGPARRRLTKLGGR
jgi:exonuclease VII small subunit